MKRAKQQQSLFEVTHVPEMRPNTAELLPLDQYDVIKIDFSGGKDSTAAVLRLLDLGVPKEKMELWHHPVDGDPRQEEFFFDWPVTTAYCKAFAAALGIRLRMQWREGGLKRELLKENARLAPVTFELSDGTYKTVGGKKGKVATRRRWPQVSANLTLRWCSAVAKIDTCSMAMSNDPSFLGRRILEVTGERREESPNRAAYAEIERHRTSNSRRRVDHWRLVIDLAEEEVWAVIRRWRIRVHPAYYIGFGRVSCMKCIFGSPDQWATVREIDQRGFNEFAFYEQDFGYTINRKLTVIQMADKGVSYLNSLREEGRTDVGELVRLAIGTAYPVDMIFVPETETWEMPAGAFKHCGGPS